MGYFNYKNIKIHNISLIKSNFKTLKKPWYISWF